MENRTQQFVDDLISEAYGRYKKELSRPTNGSESNLDGSKNNFIRLVMNVPKFAGRYLDSQSREVVTAVNNSGRTIIISEDIDAILNDPEENVPYDSNRILAHVYDCNGSYNTMIMIGREKDNPSSYYLVIEDGSVAIYYGVKSDEGALKEAYEKLLADAVSFKC